MQIHVPDTDSAAGPHSHSDRLVEQMQAVAILSSLWSSGRWKTARPLLYCIELLSDSLDELKAEVAAKGAADGRA